MAGFSDDVTDALSRASTETAVPLDTLHRFARIESGGDPRNRTGSYKGVLQLSDGEFQKHGGGDIYSARDNAMAGARKLQGESAAFAKTNGRDPSAAELYMIHQQGAAGAAAHAANPDSPAWQNMLSTGEGRRKGEGWARQAIWGNVPDGAKKQFGSVDNLSSKDFTALWAAKFGGPPTGPPTGAFGPAQDAPRIASSGQEPKAAPQTAVDVGKALLASLVAPPAGKPDEKSAFQSYLANVAAAQQQKAAPTGGMELQPQRLASAMPQMSTRPKGALFGGGLIDAPDARLGAFGSSGPTQA